MVHQYKNAHANLYKDVMLRTLKEILNDAHNKLFLKKRHEIYKENDHSYFVYYVVKGTVKTYQTNESGQIMMIDIHKSDSFFGYTTLFERKLYAESAICLEDSEILPIPRHKFISLLHTDSAFASYFIRELAHNLEAQIDRLLQQTFHSVRKRLAETLLYLYNKQKITQSSGQILSREDIAALFGTSTETFFRTLSEFQEEGLIRIHEKQGHIAILDFEGLKKIKNDHHLPGSLS